MDSRKLEKVILSWQKNDFILHQREKNKTREITTTAKQKEKSCYTVIYVQLQSRTVFVWSIAFSISTRILDRTCQCFIQFCYFLFLLFYLLIILFYFIFCFCFNSYDRTHYFYINKGTWFIDIITVHELLLQLVLFLIFLFHLVVLPIYTTMF